jgi:hypothetical protein
MQLAEERLNVERSDAFRGNRFGANLNAKAFKILSSGIYSDHIRAIIRELGTNAIDSHIMAGKPNVPFTVHLPSRLEPWFSIKDEGIGLSRESVEGEYKIVCDENGERRICTKPGLYTTYFASDKTNSNDLTGCMGLGSKSPLSYTDNFTVTTCYNGQKLVYTVYKDEEGIPAVANLSEEDTTECNGVEVSFAVEDNDFEKFRQKAELVYQYFDVKPNIVGQTVDLSRPKPDYEVNNWKLYKNECDHTLIMGNVAYPVCLRDADAHHQLFNSVSIEINCPIGAVNMTASRESLEYTERTKDVIQKATSEAVAHWTQLLLDELATQKTYWEACLFFWANQLWLKPGTQWNGKNLSIAIKVPDTEYETVQSNYGRVRTTRKRVTHILSNVRIENNVVFVENDLERGAMLRVRQEAKQHNGTRYYLVNFKDATHKKDFLDALGLPTELFIKASTLAKVKRPRNANSPQKTVRVFDPNAYKTKNYWSDEVQLSTLSGGVYVELEGYEAKGFARYELSSLLGSLGQAGYSTKLYGVRKHMLKKIAGNPNWVTLTAKLEQVKMAHANELSYIMAMDKYLQYRKLVKLQNSVTAVDISALLGKIEYVVKNEKRLRVVQPIIRRGVPCDDPLTQVKELEGLASKYPILFFIMENIDSDNWPIKDIAAYANMVNDGNSDLFQG